MVDTKNPPREWRAVGNTHIVQRTQSKRPEQKKQQAYKQIDWQGIKSTALNSSLSVLQTLLPDGKREGREWSAKNPRRADTSRGSFCVNIQTGQWKDFALHHVKGGDLISLVAYVHGHDCQSTAAQWLAKHLGIPLHKGGNHG